MGLGNASTHTRIQERGAFMIDTGKAAEAASSASNVLTIMVPNQMLRRYGVNTDKLNGGSLGYQKRTSLDNGCFFGEDHSRIRSGNNEE